ncbi:acyl carrier protein [Ureibacillus chungkukjangi]|uniref:acyl carrier protein n=1 Tax=Ureibacillus chungkukjangi TaxID=1202712 RepID=UPI002040E2EB|nr:acyl carrier protein [Ureibacillus chungkukjangi]MCM3390379.1 acyl carrier protein [Ureibacillus chungkukjangi]
MEFSDFSKVMFEILDMEPVAVVETTVFKEELEIDSLQMINLVIGVAEYFTIPFETFIQNTNKILTVGGLFKVVKGGMNHEIN